MSLYAHAWKMSPFEFDCVEGEKNEVYNLMSPLIKNKLAIWASFFKQILFLFS